MRIAVTLVLLLLASNVFAQTQQVVPRLRIGFDGSTTVESVDFGGWARWRTAGATPPVSVAGETRIYFDGTKLKISENGGAYVNLVPTTAPGTVTSVGLTVPGVIFSVAGSPVTTTGTLAMSLLTQTANTILTGPASGGAATPTFRTLVAADIPNGIISNAKLDPSECTDGQIKKRVAGVWACAADDTSVGGTSWVTGGNVVGAGTAKVGSTDNFAWNLVANNVNTLTLTPGTVPVIETPTGSIRANGVTTTHGLEASGSGTYTTYYKLVTRAAGCTSPCAPGGTESAIWFDGTSTWLKNGAAAAFVIGSGTTGPRTWISWTAQQGIQPAAGFPTFDTRNNHPVADFTNAVTEELDFYSIVPEEYDAGNVDIQIRFMASTATTGNVRWSCEIERMNTDLDADSFGTAVLVTAAVSATSGIATLAVCLHDTAAERDSFAAGDYIRVRVGRIGADAADTATGDIELLGVQMRR